MLYTCLYRIYRSITDSLECHDFETNLSVICLLQVNIDQTVYNFPVTIDPLTELENFYKLSVSEL